MKRLSLLIMLLLGTFVLISPAAAQDDDGATFPMNTITVTGTGSAFGSPDIATLEVGVETVNTDIALAFEETNTKIDTIIAALLELGVAREDIRTVNLSIFQDFSGMPQPLPGPSESGLAGEAPRQTYRVSNMIRVNIRDIATVSDVINAVVGAGANQIFGLNFGIDDRDALESEARANAIADARARAEELASLAGVELGNVLVINESFGGGFGPAGDFARMEGLGGGGAPIETGQLGVSVQLQVTYAINN